jgi:hypothetical protein
MLSISMVPFCSGPGESFDQLLSSPMWWPSSPTFSATTFLLRARWVIWSTFVLPYVVVKLTHPLCDYLFALGPVSHLINCCPPLCGGQAHPPSLRLPFRSGPGESLDQLLSSPMWWPSLPTPLCDYLFVPGPVSHLINCCPPLCGGQTHPPSLRLPFRSRPGESFDQLLSSPLWWPSSPTLSATTFLLRARWVIGSTVELSFVVA